MEEEEKTGTTQEKEPTLYEFVESLFSVGSKRLSNGDFSIETIYDNPKFFVVHLYDDKDKKRVEVSINKTIMGYFKSYTNQGYKYSFEQIRRVGIRKSRTVEEQFMESVCISEKDKIRLFKAY